LGWRIIRGRAGLRPQASGQKPKTPTATLDCDRDLDRDNRDLDRDCDCERDLDSHGDNGDCDLVEAACADAAAFGPRPEARGLRPEA
jgi:hypothetical protein